MNECDVKTCRFPVFGPLNIQSYSTFMHQSRIAFDEKWDVPFKHNETLSDFDLLHVLGSGTFGTVILVKQKRSGNHFAMKAVEKEKIVKDKVLNNVKFEKRVLQCINCPMAVHMDFFFKDKCYIYMVMPFMTGGELFIYLRKNGKFEEDQAKFIVGQIIIALEYLHAMDLVHRDVKPENIMIDHTGYVKLIDFGFCKRLSVSQRTYTLCGTPEYLAPEVILSKGYGKPVDWWAIGVLIYELKTGRSPFTGKNTMNIYEKVTSGKYFMPDYFTKDLKDLVKKLLQVDLTKRFGNLKNGVEDIKKHSWFSTIDWLALLNRRVETSLILPEQPKLDSYKPVKLKTECNIIFNDEFQDF